MRKILTEITAYVFIVLFLYTGLSKMVDHNVFYVGILGTPVLKPYAREIAVSIPIIELIVVALLLFPKSKKIGLLAAFILMVIFTCYIAFILSTSKSLPCSCGGIFYKIAWEPHLYINIFLTVLAGISILIYRRRASTVSNR